MPTRQLVQLPQFAQRHFHEHCRCPRCRMKISDEDVVAAGARRAKDGTVCFGYQYECQTCRKLYVVTDRLRAFTRPVWWTELAEWHDRARAADLPSIGPMVLDMIELDSIWIRGGYKSQVGPVMLIYSNSKSNAVEGFLRLEPDSSISLFDQEVPHSLPPSDLADFAAAVEGSTFELDGLTWTKMSGHEIEKIIHDRVFAVTTDDDPTSHAARKAQRKRRSRHARKVRKVTWHSREADRQPESCDDTIEKAERPEFLARNVSVLNCTPGNCHHADGEPASIITLGHVLNDEINPWVISMHDSRLLVVSLLVVLATNDDDFAQRLLDQHFPADEDGTFKWPDQPYHPF